MRQLNPKGRIEMHRSTEIQSRLNAERASISAALAKEKELTVSRFNALEPEDEKKLDAIEAELENARKTIARGEERIALLENRLAQVRDSERNAELDEITAKANAAREEGERLIRTDYAKAAKTLAAVLKRLAATDKTVDECNRVLSKAGRAPVRSSNAIRCTPTTRNERQVTKTLRGNDPGHPEHEFVESGFNGTGWINSKTRRPIEPVEVQVKTTDIVEGHFPEKLYDVIVLPAADAMEIVRPPSGKAEAHLPEPIYANV